MVADKKIKEKEKLEKLSRKDCESILVTIETNKVFFSPNKDKFRKFSDADGDEFAVESKRKSVFSPLRVVCLGPEHHPRPMIHYPRSWWLLIAKCLHLLCSKMWEQRHDSSSCQHNHHHSPVDYSWN